MPRPYHGPVSRISSALCGSISGRTIADVAKEKLSDAQLHELLATYIRTRDIKLRDQVVYHYRNLVESIARRFAGSAEPLEDLVQEGYIVRTARGRVATKAAYEHMGRAWTGNQKELF